MVKLTIKTVVTLAAAESACGGPLFKTGIFGTVYIIMTFYVWYMDRQWRFFDLVIKNSLSTALFSIALMFLLPISPLAVIALILNIIETGQTTETFIGIFATVSGLVCFGKDFVCVYRSVKNSF